MLYKKASDGKIQFWNVYTARKLGGANINVEFGELGGKQQTKTTHITKGKNLGKSNETTPIQQAELEARAKYDKKLKEGYVTTLEAAQSGEVDEIIEGGINPMLAHTYQDHKEKIKFPVLVQPKLNGHRCIALKTNGEVHLWSRKRHKINVPHILKQAQELLEKQPDGTFLDGELYVHGWTLGRISSAIKKTNEDSVNLQYHVYDSGLTTMNHSYKQRSSHLESLLMFYAPTYLVGVVTYYIGDEAALKPMHDKQVQAGYEGIIIRSPDEVYEYKRSYSLIKMKEMMDAEFKVLGVKSGKDKTVMLVVRVSKEVTCDVTMSGSRDENQKFLLDPTLCIGKQLTVQFQSYTPDGSLEFPVGLQIRDDL